MLSTGRPEPGKFSAQPGSRHLVKTAVGLPPPWPSARRPSGRRVRFGSAVCSHDPFGRRLGRANRWISAVLDLIECPFEASHSGPEMSLDLVDLGHDVINRCSGRLLGTFVEPFERLVERRHDRREVCMDAHLRGSSTKLTPARSG